MCKAATWSSIHTFTRHHTLVHTFFADASFGSVVLQSSVLKGPYTYLLHENCLSVTHSGTHIAISTQRRMSGYLPSIIRVLWDVWSVSVFYYLPSCPSASDHTWVHGRDRMEEAVSPHRPLFPWLGTWGEKVHRCGPMDTTSKNLSVSSVCSACILTIEYR